MKFDYLFPHIKNKCLVIDIETSAIDPGGREINIHSQFDSYVEYAEVKWFGAYSYKEDELYLLNAITQRDEIIKLLNEHDTLIGFNSEEFDFPILKNNNLVDSSKKYLHIDCMQILGANNFKNKSGYAYKNRGELMDYRFKKNSLKAMAEGMELATQKGDIDYKIFQKNKWNKEESNEIKKYLQSDVIATSEMFDKLWDFWIPFTDLLDPKFIKDLSWIKSSIASLTYKAACTLMNTEPTYGDMTPEKESMGGRVIMPKYEEKRDVWVIDYTSLYPHIMCMFNLFAENKTTAEEYGWHGNDVFKVKGYYYSDEPHILNKQIQEKLKERIKLKKDDPDNPMIQAIKIFLNGLYGVARSSIFEKVHTPNCGWDTCWLGQQIQELTEIMMDEFGFETIAGDTDSLFLLAKEEKFNNKKYVQECLNKILKKINDNVPFPIDTFNINIEKHLDYVLFPFCEQTIQDEEGKNIKKGNRLVKERKGLKKNYVMIYEENGEKKVKLKGLPIKKAGATALGLKIYNEVLKPIMLKNTTAKFTHDFIEDTVEEYLQKPNVMELIAREFRIKPADSYKKESQIQCQISRGYFNGNDGVISLIKNKKIGKAGKGTLYCTIQEAIEAKLTVKDLDLEKLWNELEAFVIYEVPIIKLKEKKIIKVKPKRVEKEIVEEDKMNKQEIKTYYEE